MEETQIQLQQFQQFALARLQSEGRDLSIDELFDQWRMTNPTSNEHAANCKAISASLNDFDRGERGTPAAEFVREFRARNGVE